MLTLTGSQSTALASRKVMRRVFVYAWGRDPITGAPDPAGFWDDVGTVELDGRIYNGSGSVVSVSTLSAKSDQSIPGITVTLSGIDAVGVAKVRGSNLAQTKIEVSLGIFDVANHEILPPLVPRFVGVIDDIEILTPAAGGKSTISLMCESASRALTIKGINTRSASSLHERAPNDKFYNYTAAMPQTVVYFGRSAPGGNQAVPSRWNSP